MGLDMYLTGNKYFSQFDYKTGDLLSLQKRRFEDGLPIKEMNLELGYWRKHPNLHGFIVNTFANGKDDCQEISLTVANMEKIIEAIKTDSLPHTTGFFFGTSRLAEEKDSSIAIFENAIKWLQTEDTPTFRLVIYRASW